MFLLLGRVCRSFVIFWLSVFLSISSTHAQFGSNDELEGVVKVFIADDFEGGESEVSHWLTVSGTNSSTNFARTRSSNSRSPQVKLEFAGDAPPGLASGTHIKIKGQFKRNINARTRQSSEPTEDVFSVQQFDVISEPVDTSSRNSSPSVNYRNALMSAATIQRNTVVTFLVDFTDIKASDNITLDDIKDTMFRNANSVNDLFETSSYGLFGLDGDADTDGELDVFGPISINYNLVASSCQYQSWGDAVQAAAQAQGIDMSLYSHKVFVLPRTSSGTSCGWSGLAGLGCASNDCRVWTRGNYQSLYSHELGHNLGLRHAATDPDNDGVYNVEYGDRSSVMGTGGANIHNIAINKDRRDWLAPFSNSIQSVLSSGVYPLSAVEVHPDAALYPTAIQTGGYTLSLRQDIGPYGMWSADLQNKLYVHRVPNPFSTSDSQIGSLLVDTLGAGEQFIDDERGLVFTLMSVQSDSTQVDIQVEGIELTPIEDRTNPLSMSVTLAVEARDLQGDPLTYTATGLPAGLAIDAATGVISGSLTQAGNYTVTIEVTDGGGMATEMFDWQVHAVNNPPQIQPQSTINSNADTLINLQIQATDLDGDVLTYSASGLPNALTINSATGVITGLLIEGGSYSANVEVSDGLLTDSISFIWNVSASSVAVQTPWRTNEHGTLILGGDPFRTLEPIDAGYSFTPLNDGVVTNLAGFFFEAGVIKLYDKKGRLRAQTNVQSDNSWQSAPIAPVFVKAGEQYQVQVSTTIRGESRVFATDTFPQHYEDVRIDYGFTIYNGVTRTRTSHIRGMVDISFYPGRAGVNESPNVINPGAQANSQDEAVSLLIQADDLDFDALTYSASGLPFGLAINPVTGMISGAPQQQGQFNITVTVNDGFTSVSETFDWTITGSNRAPSLTNPGNQSGLVGDNASLSLSASDADGDDLTYSAAGLPASLSINANTGVISGSLTQAGNYPVTVSVSDGTLNDSASFDWAVSQPNRAPSLTTPSNQSGLVGDSVLVALLASDADGDDLTYSAAGLPDGLSLISASGVISGSLTQAGNYTVTLSVSDGTLNDSASFDWAVSQPNRAPSLTNPGNQSGLVGDNASLSLSASDADGDSLTYSATNLPAGLSINGATGAISGSLTQAGDNTVTVSVSDGSLNDSASFDWAVSQPNRAPSLTNPGNQSGLVGDNASLSLSASDADGDDLTYSAAGLPDGLSINGATGEISGSLTQAGNYTVTVSVSDGTLNDSASFDWAVSQPNRAPSLTNPGNQSGLIGDNASLSLSASDADGDSLTYSATNLPAGLSINANTGVISGSLTQAGNYTVTLSVSDGTLNDSASFDWAVSQSNRGPSLTNPGNQSGLVGDNASLSLSASDADGDDLTYSATDLPAGLSINANTGVISGSLTQAGSYAVTVSVSDGTLNDSASFDWAVSQPNRAPSLTNPGNQSGLVGDNASLSLSASDADGDSLTYSVAGLPAGLSINANTGVISGSLTQAGNYTVTLSVSDGSLNDSASFDWAVSQPNRAPSLTNPNNRSELVGDNASLSLSASDADGDVLSYSATGLPAGISINANTGVISGSLTQAGNYSVTVSVSDGSLNDSASFDWAVSQPNRAPSLTNPGNQSGLVGDNASLSLSASDADGDDLTYSATDLPAGLSLNSATGVISGSLTQAGSNTVTVSVSDGSLNDSVTFDWAVSQPNRAPSLTNPGNQSGLVGDNASLFLSASDADGDNLTYSAAGLPDGLSINGATGEISGSLTQAGNNTVTVSVSDGSLNDSASFDWAVSQPNRAPSLTNPGNQSGLIGDNASLSLSASDADGDSLTYSATNLPAGLSINANTGVISGSLTQAGSYTVTLSVSDGTLNDSASFDWAVSQPNRAPSLTNPGNQSGLVGDNASLSLSASDADGDSLTYSVAGLPAGLSINANTGVISGSLTQAGNYTVTLSVSDGTLNDSASFDWAVSQPNRAPSLTNPGNQSGLVGDNASLSLSASDADGDNLTYSAAGLPAGLSLNSATGVISGSLTQAGSYAVTVSVSDGSLNDSASFDWAVSQPNRAPSLTHPGNQSGLVGDNASLSLSASDADGDNLTYSAIGLPDGLSLNGATGVISGSLTQAGSNTVTVSVSDGSLNDSASFDWAVSQPNRAPSLTNPGNQSGLVGDNVSLSLSASDADGDDLTYSATNLPAGLSINANTGAISGSLTQAGSYAVTVSVSDGTLNDSASFDWAVSQPNRAPSLTNPGNQSGLVGDNASLSLSASDADGDSLTYSATNLPAGLSINGATGAISGSLTQAGDNTVTVSVSDGSLNDSASFDWAVSQPNRAPNLTNPNNRSELVGDNASLSLSASDADGDVLSYSATGLPAGISINANTGVISGSLTQAGNYAVTVSVSDGTLSDSATFDWAVTQSTGSSTPVVVFEDDFETNTGWVINPDGTDTATGGFFEIGVPGWVRVYRSNTYFDITPYYSSTQNTHQNVLVTGVNTNSSNLIDHQFNDVDGGVTTARSPLIQLPSSGLTTIDFEHFFGSNDIYTQGGDTTDPTDYFRVSVVDPATNESQVIYQRGSKAPSRGLYRYVNYATWISLDITEYFAGTPGADADPQFIATNSDISVFNGQTVYIQVEASDGVAENSIEVGVDNIKIINEPVGSQQEYCVVSAGHDNASERVGSHLGSSDHDLELLFGADNTLRLRGTFESIISSVAFTHEVDLLFSEHSLEGTPFPPTSLQNGTSADAEYYNKVSGTVIGYINDRDYPNYLYSVQNTDVIAQIGTGGSFNHPNIYSFRATWYDTYPLHEHVSATMHFQFSVDRENCVNASDNLNRAPSLTNPGNQSGLVGDSASLSLSTSDADGDTLSYSATSLPDGLSINSNTGAISGTLTQAGDYAVTVSVSDGTLDDSATFDWAVTQPNRAPSLTNPGNQSGLVGDNASLSLSASDADGDDLSYSAAGLPDGLSINGATGEISGSLTQAGNYTVTVSVSDGTLNDSASFDWAVSQPNRAPSLTNPGNQSGLIGDNASLSLSASDADGDSLTYSATNLPAGLSINANTGVISGSLTQAGNYTVTLSVSDGTLNDSASFDWAVSQSNRGPSLTNPGNQSGLVGDNASLSLSASDADGDSLTYSATNLPAGLSINGATGTISGSLTQAGNYTVTLSVSDGTLNDSASFDWAVSQPNRAPSLTNPGNQSGLVGDNASLSLSASDADGDSLTYSVAGLPAGLSINANTGVISGSLTQAGNYTVTLSVSDGSLNDSASFDWAVSQPNRAPSLTNPNNRSELVGDNASLSLSASDADGDVLSYSATGLPAGISINANTGVISGSLTQAGNYSVTVSVSDGSLNDSASFDWAVSQPNRAPSLTNPGNQSGLVGDNASLSLSASDADGDDLTYSATDLPAGLSLNSATGVISGSLTQAGSNTVTVSVSDGSLNDSVTFDWAVSQPNRAPSLTNPGNQSGLVGDNASLFLSASDADGDNLTYSAAGLPDGLSINGATGEISGSLTQAGNYSVTVSVSDGSLNDSVTFDWAVTQSVEPEIGLCDGIDNNLDGQIDNLTGIDTDSDGVDNACDLDDDNDGLPDVVESPALPLSTVGTATLSSPFYSNGQWFTASRAIDGNPNTDAISKGLTTTDWIQIDLGAFHDIEAIRIIPRLDHYFTRGSISNAYVMLADTPFVSSDLAAALSNADFTYQLPADSSQITLHTVDGRQTNARYLRIQKSGNNYINRKYLEITDIEVDHAQDSDNDNIPDQFDLDSDNDGCFDAAEAGHGQAFSQFGVLSGPFGINGLDDDVESADASTALINYTISQRNGVYYALDSGVTDGCTEICDGIDNNLDGVIDNVTGVDTDFDGIDDDCDLDDDNDGISDAIERPVTQLDLSTVGTATQSSTHFYNGSFYASRAIDGNLESHSMTKGLTTTDWWQVDLGALHDIETIRIDPYSAMIFQSNVYVMLSDTPFVGNDLALALSNADYSYQLPSDSGLTEGMTVYTVDGKETNARYLRIQFSGTNYQNYNFTRYSEIEVDTISTLDINNNGIPDHLDPN